MQQCYKHLCSLAGGEPWEFAKRLEETEERYGCGGRTRTDFAVILYKMNKGKIASTSLLNLFLIACTVAGVKELREHRFYVDKQKTREKGRIYSLDDVGAEGHVREVFLALLGKLHVAVAPYHRVEENLIHALRHRHERFVPKNMNRELITGICDRKQLGSDFIPFFLADSEKQWGWNLVGVRYLDATDIAIDVAEMLGVNDKDLIMKIQKIALKLRSYQSIDPYTIGIIRDDLGGYDSSPPDEQGKLERIIFLLVIWWLWSNPNTGTRAGVGTCGHSLGETGPENSVSLQRRDDGPLRKRGRPANARTAKR